MSTQRERVTKWLDGMQRTFPEDTEIIEYLLSLLSEQQEPVGWRWRYREGSNHPWGPQPWRPNWWFCLTDPRPGNPDVEAEPLYLAPQQDREAMERALQEIAVNYPPGSLAHLTAKRGLGILATLEADDE